MFDFDAIYSAFSKQILLCHKHSDAFNFSLLDNRYQQYCRNSHNRNTTHKIKYHYDLFPHNSINPLPNPPPKGDLLAGSCPLRSDSEVGDGTNVSPCEFFDSSRYSVKSTGLASIEQLHEFDAIIDVRTPLEFAPGI